MTRFKYFVFLLATMMVAGFLVTACGGGSSGTADSTAADGLVTVSLTDAPGNFACYTVDVTALTLTRADGAQVSALPMRTTIDFSQYTDMTEFLTSATVPGGVYVSATMTLDYTNAQIRVENQNRQTVQVQNSAIVDENGDPVTRLQVAVQLEDRNRLVIGPGIPAHLMLDFNLEATNRVQFNGAGDPQLTVDPFLAAEVNRNVNKVHRIRGLLDQVDTENSAFTVMLRPFYCALSGSHASFGLNTVATTADTIFQINGDQYAGSEGLALLDQLDPLTPVAAIGDLMFDPLRFEAREVFVGSSVPGGALDVVEGSVVARQGDTLTVEGATLIRQDGTILFNDRVAIAIGPETSVTRQFSLDAYDQDDISVGQRVRIFGSLTETDPAALSLDATQGYALMLLTTVRGGVVAVGQDDPVAQLTVDLSSINHRTASEFDFSGTGVDAAADADPAAYEIDAGSLDLSSLQADDPVKVRGFVQPFGQAPADFNALTLINVADVSAYLKVQWVPPSADAFESLTTEGLILNLDGSGVFHHVIRGWVVTDLTQLDQAPLVVPRADGSGVFVTRFNGVVQVNLSFDDFVDTLQGYMGAGAEVHKLGAVGEFDDTSATMIANVIEVWLN